MAALLLREPKRKQVDGELLEPGKERQGQIYTWGFCTHGQLGLKETILGAREYVEIPTHAGPGSILRDVEIKNVSCGHFHTVVVDVNGNVYAFGRNDRGQLGRGGEEEDGDVSATHGAVPRRLRSLARSIVTSVTCGAFHCLARTADGVAVSWGWNKHGQLGRPTAYQADAVPDFVREAKDCTGAFKSLTAGFSHSAAVLASGQILAWGSNEFGQLGVGSAIRHPEVSTIPIPVPDVVGQQVAAGDNHLLVLSIDGQVFATGDATYGRLGIGIETPKAARARGGHLAHVLNLPWSEEPTAERMKFVSCGGATSAAISTLGRLFTWGGGVWGQLGQGSRSDADKPVVVSLQNVRHVDIAQDHMLAICASADKIVSSRSPSKSRTSSKSSVNEDRPDEEEEKETLTSSSLWVWGRRQLLPSGCCTSSDPEAQALPVEVPYDMLGCLGTLHAKGAQVNLSAVCGGSHSIVIGVPSMRADKKGRYEAVRCPWMSTVTGPGTKGGAVSEPLVFRITSRDEEGRDEKVGGLRFCVWATPISVIRARRQLGRGEGGLGQWDARPFDLQRMTDCRNGTYDGSYTIRRPGTYFFHVRMLKPGEEVDLHADVTELSRLEPGDALPGSPFRVQIESGPAFAPHCKVEIRSNSPRGTKRCRRSPSRDLAIEKDEHDVTKRSSFVVEASSETLWDICAYDLFGNAVTLTTDQFSACITRQASDAAAANEAHAAAAQYNLADGLGLPKVSTGRNSAADEIRERVRQRKAEQIWTRMSSTFTQSFGSSGKLSASISSPCALQTALRVKQSKVPGVKEIRWTPDAVGRYELRVSLLNSDKSRGDNSPCEEAIAGSPFEVVVIPGKPSALHSRLLLGTEAVRLPGILRADGTVPDVPVLMSNDDHSHAEVPIRLLLCDRMGNVCEESLDALQMIHVRIENVRLLGCETQAAQTAPLLESQVGPGGCKGLLSLRLQALPALLELAAVAAKEGKLESDSCIVQLFVSASDRASRQRLLGSPARLQLELPASTWAKAMPPMVIADVVAEAGVAIARAVEAESGDTGTPAFVEATGSPIVEMSVDTPSDCTKGLGATSTITPLVTDPEVVSAELDATRSYSDAMAVTEISNAVATSSAEMMHASQTPRSPSWKLENLANITSQSPGPQEASDVPNGSVITDICKGRVQKTEDEKDHASASTDTTAAAALVSAAVSRLVQSVIAVSSTENAHQIELPSGRAATSLQSSPRQGTMLSQPTSPAEPLPHALSPLPQQPTCPVLLPPLDERGLLERRDASVQLPPLSQSVSQTLPAACTSVETPGRRSSSHTSPLADVSEPQTGSRSAIRTRAQPQKSLDSSRALSFLPASGLAAPDRKAGNNTTTHPHGRRRAPPMSAGLVPRVAALTIAPSPWPQAR